MRIAEHYQAVDTLDEVNYSIRNGDCLDVIKAMPDNSIDSIVTDPPYGLSNHSTKEITDCLQAWILGKEYHQKKTGFMGHSWDGWVPGPEVWRECLRVLKPGGYLLAFAGTRTMDLMSMAIRLGGFELRDNIGYAHEEESEVGGAPIMAWAHGNGFPKSLNVSKAIDKAAGADRKVIGQRKHPTLRDQDKLAEQAGAAHGGNNWNREWDLTDPTTEAAKKWEGWGTALKPAWEPIIIARKPLQGTVAENVLKYVTGALNIEACRVESEGSVLNGRFPANLVHDGSDTVVSLFPESKGQLAKTSISQFTNMKTHVYGDRKRCTDPVSPRGDAGSAARFFYCAKTSSKDRHEGCGTAHSGIPHGSTYRQIENLRNAGQLKGNNHPTVKPTPLMRYLVRLVTPPGGTSMDPFVGSGSSGKAAILEGFSFIGIDKDESSCEIAEARCAYAYKGRNAHVSR